MIGRYENDSDDDDDLADIVDDEDEDVEDGGILQDGESLKVPITFMDAEMTKALREKYPPLTNAAAHRPGFRTPDHVDDAVETARLEYCRWLTTAHRTPSVTVADANPVHRPRSLADSRAAANAAYEERNEWLRNAYKERQPRRRLKYGWEFGDRDEANGA